MNLQKNLLLTLALVAVLPGAVLAETLVVTPEGLPSLVRKGNPSLAAARLAIDEAAGRLLGAGRLSNPELELGGQHNHKFKEGGVDVGLSQKFPLTERLKYEREVSTAELERARAEVADSERLLIAEAKVLVIKLLALDAQQGLLVEQKGIAEELVKSIGDAAKRGEASTIDAGQAKIEVMRIQMDVRGLGAERASFLGELKQFIGVASIVDVRVGGQLTDPVLPAGAVDVSKRSDYLAMRHAVDGAESRVVLEREKRLEDLEVGLVAGWQRAEDAPDGFENEGIIGVRMTLPLPFWNKNEGGIAEAEASAKRRLLEAVALEQDIRNESSTAHAEMREWLGVIQEIGSDALPAIAEQAVTAEKAYRNGQLDLQNYLRVREQQLALQVSRLRALENFHLARVRYEAARGEF